MAEKSTIVEMYEQVLRLQQHYDECWKRVEREKGYERIEK